jgi:RimJ/RimL family protein N-acetyltransferase
MPQNIPSVELLKSKSIELFIPVLREVDLGDRFLLSMLHWCGIGQRSTPLDYWQVFLIQRADETVGVAGLYRQPQMEKDTCWIGWFGVRPAFRRQGIGTSTIQNLIAAAKKIGCKTLWVYTGADAHAAIQFYQKLGFAVVGRAKQCAPGQTMDDSDIVLRCPL